MRLEEDSMGSGKGIGLIIFDDDWSDVNELRGKPGCT
jgi:hypothetical protein